MVANLQQVGVKLFGKHLPLAGRLGIAFEQHRGLPVGHMEHQGIVIAGGGPGRVIGWRSKHFDLRAAESKVLPAAIDSTGILSRRASARSAS